MAYFWICEVHGSGVRNKDAVSVKEECPLCQLSALAPVVEARPLTLRRLQDEQRPWVEHNFAGREPFYPLLGAVEELGELAHAHLKALQGIRGTAEEHHAAKVDAVADAIIFLADYCTANGIDMQQALEDTWARVKVRDWKADPVNGCVLPREGDAAQAGGKEAT